MGRNRRLWSERQPALSAGPKPGPPSPDARGPSRDRANRSPRPAPSDLGRLSHEDRANDATPRAGRRPGPPWAGGERRAGDRPSRRRPARRGPPLNRARRALRRYWGDLITASPSPFGPPAGASARPGPPP